MGEYLSVVLIDKTTGHRSARPMFAVDGDICDVLGVQQHDSGWAQIVDNAKPGEVGLGIDWYNTFMYMLDR